MKRARRIAGPEKPKPQPRESTYIKVTRIKGNLFYRGVRDEIAREEKRWYYLGRIRVAFVQKFWPARKDGTWNVFMNSVSGNAGKWFGDEEQMLVFIIDELEKAPG